MSEIFKNSVRGRPPNDPQETRSQLITTAAEMFNIVSYFDTNTNKIAKNAGFAPATFYRHFKDKRDIFLSCYSYWVGANWDAVERDDNLPDDPMLSAEQKTRALIENHYKWGGYRKNLYALAATDTQVNEFIREERAKQIKRLTKRLEKKKFDISPGAALYSFFSIERAANAIIDGDVAALGIDVSEFSNRIKQEIFFLETGTYTC